MIGDPGEPPTSEDDCAVCGQWPAADRRSMRLLIDTLPMQEAVCDRCLMAFWRNCIVPLLPPAGRVEATEAARAGWTAPAAPAQAQPFDPIAIIDRLVQDAVAQRLPQLPALQASSILPTPEPAAPPRTDEAAENTSSLMSEVLADFLKPLDRKRKHTAKSITADRVQSSCASIPRIWHPCHAMPSMMPSC